MTRTVPEGIYYQPGVRPGLFFAIAFLALTEKATASRVQKDLVTVWDLLRQLKQGISPEYPAHPVPSGNLTTLLCYGANIFRIDGTSTLPPQLSAQNRFLSPRAVGGGPLLIGSGLSYAEDISRNIATEAVAIQFIADTQLAVYRAVVETWSCLTPTATDTGEGLRFGGFLDGFSRDDGRSWIGFHDGVSNMRSGLERENALRIKTGPNTNGTTLCFLRLEIDLPAWRALTRGQQELTVGRDKLSGCPFSHSNLQGEPVAKQGCPVMGSTEVNDSGNESYRVPDAVPLDSKLAQSHVQRANQAHRSDTDIVQSFRIFRQGYEFFEPLSSPPGFRSGLNFVSYQDSPARIIGLLTRERWLGRTNFGGDPDQPLPGMNSLLKVRAGGIFLAPPQDDALAFPGADFFIH